MAALPQRLPLLQMQQQWATTLNPVIANPITQGLQLNNITITTGNNVVNHKLGRKLQGWFVVGINGVATIFDTQATNQMSDLTLNLTSSADVLVNLWVF
jgi:hypothetical protein